MDKQTVKNNEMRQSPAFEYYRNWLENNQNQNNTAAKVDLPNNPLDWYVLTETANSILNELIAYTAREEIKELEKPQPDKTHINELQTLFKQIHAINSDPMNFKSAKRMGEIINQYGPILMTLHNGL